MNDGAKIGLGAFDNKLQLGYFANIDYLISQGYHKKIFGDSGPNCCINFLDVVGPSTIEKRLVTFMNSWNCLWGDKPFINDVLLTEPPVICEHYTIVNERTGSIFHTISIALRNSANFKELAKGNIAFADLLLTYIRFFSFLPYQPRINMGESGVRKFLYSNSWTLNYKIDTNIQPIVHYPTNKQLNITGFEQYAYWVVNHWHDFNNYLYYNIVPKIIGG